MKVKSFSQRQIKACSLPGSRRDFPSPFPSLESSFARHQVLHPSRLPWRTTAHRPCLLEHLMQRQSDPLWQLLLLHCFLTQGPTPLQHLHSSAASRPLATQRLHSLWQSPDFEPEEVEAVDGSYRKGMTFLPAAILHCLWIYWPSKSQQFRQQCRLRDKSRWRSSICGSYFYLFRPFLVGLDDIWLFRLAVSILTHCNYTEYAIYSR